MAPYRTTVKTGSPYLEQTEVEPVAQRHLKLGDSIVVCDCGRIWLTESWDQALSGRCSYCGAHLTVNPVAAQTSDVIVAKPSPYREARRRYVNPWMIVVLLLGLLIARGLLPGNPPPETPTLTGPVVQIPPIAGASTQAPVAPSSVPSRPTNATTILPEPLSQAVEFSDRSLGTSAGGRTIDMIRVGYSGGPAIIVVGSIQGEQSDTSDVVDDLIRQFRLHPEDVPYGSELYLIPSLNPDGNAHNLRFNDNDVDLNRNWDTFNWRSDPPVPGYPNGKPGAGGSRPFSEPETRALRDLVLELKALGRFVYVFVLHSSVNLSKSEVFPGYTQQGVDVASDRLTALASRILDYRYETQWAAYQPVGEVIGWCAEHEVPSVDIVSIKNRGPGPAQVIELIRAILE